MQDFLKSLSDDVLLHKYHHYHEISTPGPAREAYHVHMHEVFHKADENKNGIIEDHEIMDLITHYYDKKGFHPGDAVIHGIIADYEPGGKFDQDGEIGVNREEFIDLTDRVNATMIVPAYAQEIKSRGLTV